MQGGAPSRGCGASELWRPRARGSGGWTGQQSPRESADTQGVIARDPHGFPLGPLADWEYEIPENWEDGRWIIPRAYMGLDVWGPARESRQVSRKAWASAATPNESPWVVGARAPGSALSLAQRHVLCVPADPLSAQFTRSGWHACLFFQSRPVSLFHCDCRFTFSSVTFKTSSFEVILLGVFKAMAVLSSCWTDPVARIKCTPLYLLALIWSEQLSFS